MKLVDVKVPDHSRAIHGKIDFTYVPSERAAKRWVNVVSLKKTDKESVFVFRVNHAEKQFQLYFGDGTAVRGSTKIGIDGFCGERCRLAYTRTKDFTILFLSAGDTKVARFILHKGAATSSVAAEYYEEGRPEDGITVYNCEFSSMPAVDVSLSDIESDLLSDPDVSRDAGYVNALNSIGMTHFSGREYLKALSTFRAAYKLSSPRINHHAFAKAMTSINRSYSGADRVLAWGEFSAPNDVIFGNARDALLGRDVAESLKAFERGVDHILGRGAASSDRCKEKLSHAFSMLVKGVEGGVPSRIPEVASVEKVIVSGMGWSGSGAIYDYLQEFDGVVAVPGESPYIEGTESLLEIHSSLEDDWKLKQRVVDFFFYALVGYGNFRNAGDYKLFRYARSKLLPGTREAYLGSVEGWCALASAMCSKTGQERRELFALLSDYTINHFSIGRDVSSDEVVLLDNVVHITNADKCIPFLNNTTLLCTFRDPRSNYVALVREASYFNSSAAAYVQERKRGFARSRQAAETAAERAEGLRDKSVEIINFEEFVLSDDFRKSLAGRLGLSLESQNKFSHFRPWESMRNVFLHQEHPAQEEIRLIEKELGEYCYEPCIRPLKESRQVEG